VPPHISIGGRVADLTEESVGAHIDSLVKKYLNLDRYPNRKPGEVRIIYKIEPERTHAMG
jgi:predicted alpha/beta-hydrolase family hydrolase